MDASLARKLLHRAGAPFAVVGAPPGHAALVADAGALEGAGLVLIYAASRAEARARVARARPALGNDARLWVAYPKAKQLSTDLSRDVLVETLRPLDLQPVRQVSVDETWSAMWFKMGPGAGAPRRAPSRAAAGARRTSRRGSGRAPRRRAPARGR
jgi:hypothetical protein